VTTAFAVRHAAAPASRVRFAVRPPGSAMLWVLRRPPQAGAAGIARQRRPLRRRLALQRSHGRGGGGAEVRLRTCRPASVSRTSRASPSHRMRRRVGMRSSAAAPYASQRPSCEMSHWSATRRPSSLSGTLA
jgi:hypothetical protein